MIRRALWKQLLSAIIVGSAAGCVVPPTAPAAAGASSLAPAHAQALAGTATVEGTVLDDEYVPVEGARVEVIYKGEKEGGQRLQLGTDAGGRFFAESLAGGEYAVYVDKLGFREPPPKIVAVGEGETVKIGFVLDRIRVYTAYHESLPYRSRSNAFVCTPGCLGWWDGANLTYAYEVDELRNGPLQTLIHEMRWPASIPGCPGGRRGDVFSPQQETITAAARTRENPYYWTNVPDTGSPTHAYIPRDGGDAQAMMSAERTERNGDQPILTTGKWLVDSFHYHYDPYGLPVAFSCGGDQTTENWLTAFYVAPAPTPDWSAFPE